MGYQIVPVSDFGGLDLVSSPDGSRCIDQLNVDLDRRGELRSRDGYDNFTGSELTNQPDSLFPHYTSSGTKRLLVGNNGRLDALDTSGTSVANITMTGGGPCFFARFGGPTAEVTYILNGSDDLHRYDTAAGFASLALVNYKFPAITPVSNRLMVARFAGVTAGNNPASVYFSVPGAPQDFTVANGAGYKDLDPGDGEGIMGVRGWRNYVFVFKETKFWVYYGEQPTSSGASEFLFRKVGAGTGLAASRALCAGREGLYFLDRTGVYVTNGGDPEPISGPIESLFFGPSAHSFYQGDEINQAAIDQAAMVFHNERLYLSVPVGASTTNNRMFVYDPRTRAWLDWDIAAAALSTFRISNAPELVFAYPTGLNYIGRHSTAYTTDDGTAITSRYRTGFTDMGAPGQEKDIDSTRLWGTGTVAVAGSRDFGSLDAATNVTLGTAPAVVAGLHNKQKRGEMISYQFANVSGGAIKLHRYAHYLRDQSPPGKRSA